MKPAISPRIHPTSADQAPFVPPTTQSSGPSAAPPPLESALFWSQGYEHEVLSRVPQDPASPELVHLLLTIAPRFRDNLVRAIAKARGAEWLLSCPLPVREMMARFVRTGILNEFDKQLYRALVGSVRDEKFRTALADMNDPEARRALGAHYRNALAPKDGTGVSINFRGTEIVVPAQPPAQKGIDFVYRHLFETDYFDKPAEVRAAMIAPLAQRRGGDGSAYLPGTTVMVNGVGNVAPAAAYLFYLARHTEKLVLAYNKKNVGDDLRELTSYRGVPVPPSLRGKIFAIGDEYRDIEPAETAAGVFIRELDEIDRRKGEFGFDLSPLNVVAHSAGNNAVLLARHVLAAHGYPDLISRHIALAPAVRGTLIADDNRPLATLADLLGKDAGRAVSTFDPDVVGDVITEPMRLSVDLVAMGLTPGTAPARYRMPVLALARLLGANKAGWGSDGLIDGQAIYFGKNPEASLLLEKGYDHFTVVGDPEAAAEWLSHVEVEPDPGARVYLDAIAPAKSAA